MRIALVSPMMVEVPPRTYGGTQLMVYELAMGLAEKGHHVSVFCSAGSRIRHENIRVVHSSPYPTMSRPGENRFWEARQMLDLLSCQNDFDIIHFFYEPIIFDFEMGGHGVNLLTMFRVPVISSFRNLTEIPEHIAYYRKNKRALNKIHKVFNSKKQRSFLSFLSRSEVIYNGLDLSRYEFGPEAGDYLFFLGRIIDGKGIIEAIKAAKKSGEKLIIAAKICDGDRDFYEKSVRPLIDGRQIRYVGEVGFRQKISYLKRAKALLFPIKWEEPFGNVVAEALACGTPVIAFCRGAMPEIIKDGYNGFLCDKIDDLVAAIGRIGEIKRKNCRMSVEKNFSKERMVDSYEALYGRESDSERSRIS